MRLLRLGATLCAVFAATAAAQSPGATSVGDLIAAARRAQNAMIRVRDIDSAATFWTTDVIVLAGLGARVEGRDALRAAFEQDSVILYQRHPDEITPSAGWPLAWERGRWTGALRADTSVVLITGWYSARWLRVGDRWLIQSEQFVADECHRLACQWPLVVRRAAP
jgi:hypothetical protein